MIEILDYYALGLDKRKDVVDLHKNANKEYLDWLKKEQGAKPGTPAAAKAAIKKDQWSKALVLFSSEEGRKKYDAELTAWQNSIDAQRAKGQVDQLAKDFASATETVLELVARAWEELDKGNLQAASQVASKAMRVDASHWEAYLIAGIASFRQNDFEESMSCIRQAARLNPNDAQVYGCLGELYERQDNWQEAFKQYSKAISLAPDDIDFKIKAGLVCVKAEVPDQGIELLRKALEIDPDHQGAKWALGVALVESTRLGWTEVQDGHPRVPPGWYAMSREQALQAIRKLHEANALGVVDQELSADLANGKKDVDRNVKRHFDGSWVLLGVILIVAFFLKGNIWVSLLVATFAAAYYGAHLPPQYSTNARVLAGDSKLKTGFFDWLDNIQNQWIKLTINLILIALLPIFTLYFAIQNWTGENAPLGDALKDIRGPSSSNQNDVNDLNNRANKANKNNEFSNVRKSNIKFLYIALGLIIFLVLGYGIKVGYKAYVNSKSPLIGCWRDFGEEVVTHKSRTETNKHPSRLAFFDEEIIKVVGGTNKEIVQNFYYKVIQISDNNPGEGTFITSDKPNFIDTSAGFDLKAKYLITGNIMNWTYVMDFDPNLTHIVKFEKLANNACEGFSATSSR